MLEESLFYSLIPGLVVLMWSCTVSRGLLKPVHNDKETTLIHVLQKRFKTMLGLKNENLKSYLMGFERSYHYLKSGKFWEPSILHMKHICVLQIVKITQMLRI